MAIFNRYVSLPESISIPGPTISSHVIGHCLYIIHTTLYPHSPPFCVVMRTCDHTRHTRVCRKIMGFALKMFPSFIIQLNQGCSHQPNNGGYNGERQRLNPSRMSLPSYEILVMLRNAFPKKSWIKK